MNEGLIPRRYAKALLRFAQEKDAAAHVYQLMQQTAASFDAAPALQQTMANPFVSADDKRKLIATAAGLGADGHDPILDDFVSLLIARGRIEFFRMIALAYIELYRKENNIFSVKVTSAAPLAPDELSRIEALVGRHLGPDAKMEFTAATDPDLIGGFAISVGNERLDATVANELRQLRRRLVDNIQ